VEKALEGDQVNVIALKDQDGLNIVLSKMIGDTLAINGKDNPAAISMIGQTIKSKYYYFRLGEIAMVLQKGVTGYYGNVPSGVIPILYWMEQYDIGERLTHVTAEQLKHSDPYEKQFEEMDEKERRKELTEFNKAYKRKLNEINANEKAKRATSK